MEIESMPARHDNPGRALPRAARHVARGLVVLLAACGGGQCGASTGTVTPAAATPASAPVAGTVMAATATSGLSAASAGFYVDPGSQANVWVNAHATDGRTPAIRASIASQAAARWFTGGTTDIGADVASYVGSAAAAGRTPILVAYDIPDRDCGQASSGGASSVGAYRQWIATFAAGVGTRAAVVVLEPDALAQLDCLGAADQADRLSMLSYATQQFKAKAPVAKVYLDIGHSGWLSTDVAAQRLVEAGVANVRGFSLDVSNFKTTADETTYGKAIASALAQDGVAGRTFVVDTSRNGNGPLGSQWCDPAGRRIGAVSAQAPTGSVPEMTLWVKNPGVADGCADPAGVFDPELAYKLVYGY
jgi:endoglucanase